MTDEQLADLRRFVKPLEWIFWNEGDRAGATANSMVGKYQIISIPRLSIHNLFFEDKHLAKGDYTDLKPAAQADYADRILSAVPALLDEVVRLRAEADILHNAGIVEIAVRNPSVMDYVRHWEARAQAAEIARLTAERDVWREDPAASDAWSAGCDFAMNALCKMLRVDPKDVSWDAATETLDGDVASVVGNILTAGLGEDWPDLKARAEAAEAQVADAYARGLRDAAVAGYRACAETRHVTLGQKVERCILALIDAPKEHG